MLGETGRELALGGPGVRPVPGRAGDRGGRRASDATLTPPGAADQARLFELTLALLDRLSAERPLVLVARGPALERPGDGRPPRVPGPEPASRSRPADRDVPLRGPRARAPAARPPRRDGPQSQRRAHRPAAARSRRAAPAARRDPRSSTGTRRRGADPRPRGGQSVLRRGVARERRGGGGRRFGAQAAPTADVTASSPAALAARHPRRPDRHAVAGRPARPARGGGRRGPGRRRAAGRGRRPGRRRARTPRPAMSSTRHFLEVDRPRPTGIDSAMRCSPRSCSRTCCLASAAAGTRPSPRSSRSGRIAGRRRAGHAGRTGPPLVGGRQRPRGPRRVGPRRRARRRRSMPTATPTGRRSGRSRLWDRVPDAADLRRIDLIDLLREAADAADLAGEAARARIELIERALALVDETRTRSGPACCTRGSATSAGSSARARR